VRAEDLHTRKELQDKFGWEEYLICCLMLAVSAGVGVFFWWKGQKNSADMLLGGRKMGVGPVCLSLTVRYIS